jgi:hypothetical protein
MNKIADDKDTNDVLNNSTGTCRLDYVRDAISASKKLAKIKVQHPMVEAMRAQGRRRRSCRSRRRWRRSRSKVVKGRENAIPSGYVRTRENTGTCPVCFRNIKLTDDQKMVHHGYERPGHGYIVGDCFTVKTYLPYELSAEGTKAFISQSSSSPMLEREQAPRGPEVGQGHRVEPLVHRLLEARRRWGTRRSRSPSTRATRPAARGPAPSRPSRN